MKFALLVLPLIALGLAEPARAQAQPPAPALDAAVRTQVIDAAITALRARYVFPDVATKLELALRDRVTAHAYDRMTSGPAFADQVTKDLQAVSHDKHLRLRYSANPVAADSPNTAPSAEEKAELHRMTQQLNAGFVKVERLDGNIGYIRLDYFLPPQETSTRVAAAMTLVADTDALILDLRNNHGGDPTTVALVVSYLYDDYADIHINDIYMRPENATRQYWVLGGLPGPRYPDKPVYVLTSQQTFSGGEECAYDLQNLKRATLIGETTGGGANPGGPVKVGEHFALFVPTGRAINPVSKTNWEGVGVKPTIATAAAKAFDVAYLDALHKQRARLTAKHEPGVTLGPGLDEEIDRAIAAVAGKK